MHYKTYKKRMTKRRSENRKYNIAFAAFMIGVIIIGMSGQIEAYKFSADQPLKHVVKPKISEIKVIQLVSKSSYEAEIRETASKLCKVKKLGEYCIKDLVAILNNETRFDFKIFKDGKCVPNGYSDGGKAMGCYQIHQEWHPEVTRAQAENLQWAMSWSLNYLVGHGYPKYRSFAIRSFNGSPKNPQTAKYLLAVNNF